MRIEGKRYRKVLQASRELTEGEESFGLPKDEFRVIDSEKSGVPQHWTTPEPQIPILRFGETIGYIGTVCFSDLGIKVRGGVGGDYVLPVIAATLYLVEGGGERKAVYCDENGSYELPIAINREKLYFDEIMNRMSELEMIEEVEVDDGEDEYFSLEEEIEEMVMCGRWLVSKVAGEIGLGMGVADAVFKARGRMDSEIVF